MEGSFSKFKLLFLDDDPVITKLAKKSFKNVFSIITTTSVKTAFELINENNVGIVVSDFHMPEMNGIEFLNNIRKDHPSIKRVLITGQMDLNIAVNSVNEAHIDLIVEKPWNYLEFKNNLLKLKDDFIKEQSIDDEIIQLKKKQVQLKSDHYRYADNLLDTLGNLQETEKISEFATHFLSVLQGIQSITLVNLEFYLDSKDEIILNHVFGYLSDIEIIANQYDQKSLTLYVLLLRGYVYGISKNYKEARLNYLGAQALYQWIKDSYITQNMLDALEQFPIKNEDTNIIDNPMIINVLEMHIKRLLKIKIGELINITVSIFDLIANVSLLITYFVVIRDEIPIYDKTARDQEIEASLISGFVVALSQFLKETVKGSGEIDTISHNRGVILIHSQKEIRYVLFLSANDIRFRIALREFAFQSEDILNGVPENHLVSDKERKLLNDLSDKVFGEF